MAQSGYTPISLYYTTTAAAVPVAGNLVAGELALNTADGKLYFKNSSNVVTLLASASDIGGVSTFSGGTTGLTPSTATSGAVTLAGTLATTNGGTGLTSFTSGGAMYATSTSALTTGTLPVTAGGTGLTSLTSGYIPYGNGSSAFQSSTNLSFNGSTLAVSNGGGASGLSINSSVSTASIWTLLSNTTNSLYIGVDNSSGTAFGLPYCTAFWSGNATYPMAFFTNNAARLVILANGQIGVGTSSPTALLHTSGSSSVAAFKTPNIDEVTTVSATAATGTINFDITTQSILYYTTNASGNWTLNIRGSSGTSLNTIMSTGESMSCTFLATQGSTAYYNSSVQVDGTTSGVTTKWQGGSAPTSGNASSVDSYTYVVTKTGSATFTVLATQTKFA